MCCCFSTCLPYTSTALPSTQLVSFPAAAVICKGTPPPSATPLPQIAKYARANVEANGLAGQVTIVSSKVEALNALPLPPADAEGQQPGQQQAGQQAQQQVDVLVSEWMGYALLFESMLGSVLHARDRWLRPGGAVLPDVANIYVAAAGAGASGLGFWSDVYGFRWAGGGGGPAEGEPAGQTMLLQRLPPVLLHLCHCCATARRSTKPNRHLVCSPALWSHPCTYQPLLPSPPAQHGGGA